MWCVLCVYVHVLRVCVYVHVLRVCVYVHVLRVCCMLLGVAQRHSLGRESHRGPRESGRHRALALMVRGSELLTVRR